MLANSEHLAEEIMKQIEILLPPSDSHTFKPDGPR